MMSWLKRLVTPKWRHQTREAESLAKAEARREVARRKRIWRQIGIALLAFLPVVVAIYIGVVWAINLIAGCPL